MEKHAANTNTNTNTRPYVLQLMALRGLDLSEVEDWVIDTRLGGYEVTVAFHDGHLESWDVSEGCILRTNLGFADGIVERVIPPMAVRVAVA